MTRKYNERKFRERADEEKLSQLKTFSFVDSRYLCRDEKSMLTEVGVKLCPETVAGKTEF